MDFVVSIILGIVHNSWQTSQDQNVCVILFVIPRKSELHTQAHTYILMVNGPELYIFKMVEFSF